MLVALAPACARSAAEAEYVQARQAMWRGELAEAQKLADDGVARTSSDPNSVVFWRFRLLSGEVAILRRDFPAAESVIAARLPAAAEFDALRARQKFLDGKLKVARGQLQAARDALAEARRAAPATADVLLDIDHLDGQALMRLGKWADAETILNRVVAAAGDGDRYHQAVALNDLGMGRLVRSRYDEALPYFERVASLPDASGLSVYAASLSNAGMCYERLGMFDRALATQQRAFDIHQRRGKREYFVQALGEMGNLHVLRGEPRQAQPFLKRAFDEATAANLLPEAALWARNLAYAETLLNDWDEAERYDNEAKRLKAAIGAKKVVYNTLVSAAIAEGRGRLDEARRQYEAALNDGDANASVRWGAHAGLAGVAMKSRDATTAARHFEAALDIIEKTRSDLLKTDYKLSYLTQLISFYRDYVDALLARGQVERALEIADSSRGQVLAERQHVAAPPRARAAELRRLAADSRTVFVSYWLTPDRSSVWIVRPDGISALTLPAAREIEPLVREHQAAIANALADPLAAADSAGDKLFRILVAPLARWLPPGSSVVIVPDGVLHGVNFETLPASGTASDRRHYWIEDVEIQVAPSLAGLAAAAPHPSTSLGALVVGDSTPRPPDFPALQYAPAEMSAITQHFGAANVTSFDRDRATPAAYRGANPNRFAFVHFAAHATANVESPLDSAVILSGPGDGYKLYVRDVANQPLSAELVTVSACRSAGERAYSGEGLVGFAWAFLRAGARRVIAGLWDVNDRSTADLMGRLYAGIAAGERPAKALREAKLALLRQGGSVGAPYSWGAFELFTVTPR